MDPITLIAGATSIARALGLDEKIGRLLGGEKGADVAKKVIDATKLTTGTGSLDDALLAINRDREAYWRTHEKLIELEAAESARMYADIADARALQTVALGQEDSFSKRFVYYFATAWSIFAMGYLALITFMEIPAANQRFADTILGFLLGTIIATIIVYFYGSSRSSHGKDSTLSNLVDTMKEKLK